MENKYSCGVEGGATHSTVVILDHEGIKRSELLGEPPTNHWIMGQEACCNLLASMIRKALNEAGVQDETALVAVGLCLSGCEDEKTNEELRQLMHTKLPHVKNIVVASDTVSPITAVSKNGGIVLISGTGSNCLLVNPDGSTGRCGGWGYMLGDEGSAYWVAFRAVKICMLEQDNYELPPYDTTYIWDAIRAHFNVEDRFGILYHHHAAFDKPLYAGLALKLAEGADNGDKLCQHIFYTCGQELAKHVLAVKKDIQEELYKGPLGLLIVCTGSVWKSWDHVKPGFLSDLAIKEGEKHEVKIKKFSLVRLNVPSSIGAALLSARKFGIESKNLQDNFNVFYSYDPDNQ